MEYTQADDSQSVIKKMVHSQMPLLRRYGRAICGQQRIADLSVLQVMEDLVVEPSIATDYGDERAALYAQLQKNIESFMLPNAIPTPKSRQALLLKDVEGLSNEQAGRILDVSGTAIDTLCVEANEEISRDVTARVLIIEDEVLISSHLQSLMEDIGYAVVAVARTETEAVAASLEHRPNLILSDVHLADGSSGQDAVERIKVDNNAPVVFITAYPERLLTGTCPEPAFLIAKPFDEKAVMATVSQAYFLDKTH